uniref:Uncharacterized protein n=1 Tax=Rhizophora mucronata TaxID=61149 RepID=A0A2P2M7F7_RHIMU
MKMGTCGFDLEKEKNPFRVKEKQMKTR